MRQISMAKKGPRWADADVDRRDGWRDLTVGTDLEVIEWSPWVGARWSPRVGARWVCEECGYLGSTRQAPRLWCPEHGMGSAVSYRFPRRLGVIRVLDVRREPLGAILTEPHGVRREGFRMTPAQFCRLYVGGKGHPHISDEWTAEEWKRRTWVMTDRRLIDFDREVTRIVYRVVEVYP